MEKKEIIRQRILDQINVLDIAGYLKDELEKDLSAFHCYKLNNILKNIEFLSNYLIFLDQKSTKQIHQLDHEYIDETELGDHDLYYYISKKGLGIVGEKKLKQKIRQNDFNLSSIMMGIKGFLLLTIDEFCNATPVRLSIDQIFWNKEYSVISDLATQIVL